MLFIADISVKYVGVYGNCIISCMVFILLIELQVYVAVCNTVQS